MEKYLVLAAGGSGTRMMHNTPKQFIPIGGKPVLVHTIRKFVNVYPEIRVVVCVPKEFLETARNLMQSYFPDTHYQVVTGGQTRFESVQKGINSITGENGIVFVHDAARCLVSESLIVNCYTQTLEKGNAVPCIVPSDSLRVVNGDHSSGLPRETVRLVQTPQTFFLADLQQAFQQANHINFSDEALVVEASGKKIHLLQGELQNLKITTPVDLAFAVLYMNKPIA